MTKFFCSLIVAALAMMSSAGVTTANGAVVIEGNEVDRIATLRNVSITKGEISGEVVNNLSDTLRDVVLEIKYSWRWTNEFHPGTDDPGRTDYYNLVQEIAPGGSARFDYKPSPPLKERGDGAFVIDVKIAGFERVYR
jgi:hypothetical protein